MKHRITIIGDGGWGTALALVLHGNGHAVTVWGPFADYISTISDTRENKLYLPGVRIPDDITWTADRQQAAEHADLIVMAVPTKFYADVARSFAPLIKGRPDIVSVAKGFDPKTEHRMTEIVEEILPHRSVSALSGPSHAEEVARGIPTAVVLASTSDSGRSLQSLFANRRFRVYTASDVKGVEIGGALKNVIAIAVGTSDGIGFGDNTRAALITRGLAEITRLGIAMGAEATTFAGLSGMGDLIVTCASRLSRNRSVGERIGRGENPADIIAGMKQVAEGVTNSIAVRDLGRKYGIATPISDEVCAVVHEGKDPHAAVESLLSRAFRPE